MVSTYRELEKVCKTLGLTPEQKKKGVLWSGMANGKFARVVIHKHCEGRDLKICYFSVILDKKIE